MWSRARAYLDFFPVKGSSPGIFGTITGYWSDLVGLEEETLLHDESVQYCCQLLLLPTEELAPLADWTPVATLCTSCGGGVDGVRVEVTPDGRAVWAKAKTGANAANPIRNLIFMLRSNWGWIKTLWWGNLASWTSKITNNLFTFC